MKLRVNVADSGTFIVLPAELAGPVSQILTSATLFERDGWSSPAIYKRSKGTLSVEFIADDSFAPMTEREAQAAEEAKTKSNQHYQEYTKRIALEKKVADLESQIAGIQSVTVCKVEETSAPSFEGVDSPMSFDDEVEF